MAKDMGTGLRHMGYGLGQMARIGWYSLHYFAGRHMVGPLTAPGAAPYAAKSSPADLKVLEHSFRQLFRDEWNMIEAGVYKVPHDLRKLPDLGKLLRNSRTYFQEARAVARRAYAEGGHSEVFDDKRKEQYPRYYLQNFHFQSEGWLSENSAKIYDMQVETLFTGAAGAMRRQALPFIRDEIIRAKSQGRDQKDLTFVDLACGTAPLLSYVRDNFPQMDTIAIDLSPNYLREAKQRLAPWPGVRFAQGLAETIPLADSSVDMLMSVYLFHELPPKIREKVSAEIARILKPGGVCLHLDTIQYGDEPGLDILLENFPRAFHEPYYDTYCKQDLSALFGASGLTAERSQHGFLTKVDLFRK